MRKSWDDYFFNIAKAVAERSSCARNNRAVGCVVVKDNRIVGTGYNGAPAGVTHCTPETCLRRDIPSGTRHELCRGAHAETNAIATAARYGVSLEGATLYCTHSPCSMCIKSIINAGISKILYLEGYPDELAYELWEEGGVSCEIYTSNVGSGNEPS